VATMDVAQDVREARERAGLELEEAAERVGVPTKYLRAVEWDRLDLLPHGEEMRDALRLYAELVAVAPDPLLERYDHATAAHAEEPAPAAAGPEREPPEEPEQEVEPAPDAMSNVTLAAAARTFELAADDLMGVRESLERAAHARVLTADEIVPLWVHVQRARETARRLDAEAERLANLLMKAFLTDEGRWPLTSEEERQYHEVQAAIAAAEADTHRRLLDAPREGQHPEGHSGT
jgi:hypothetical protein